MSKKIKTKNTVMSEENGEQKEVRLLQELFYFVAKNTAKRSRPPRELIEKLDAICLLKYGKKFQWFWDRGVDAVGRIT